MNHFFYTLSSFLVATLFLIIGAVTITMPWIPEVHATVLSFLVEQTLALSLFGFLLILIGIAILFYLALMRSEKVFYIKKGTHSISVDHKVLEGHLDAYLKELFPSDEVPHQLFIRKQRILISADLPYRPKKEQQSLSEKMYDDLVHLLEDQFNCTKDLYLSISFEANPQEKDRSCAKPSLNSLN